jgi:hypothetical protein
MLYYVLRCKGLSGNQGGGEVKPMATDRKNNPISSPNLYRAANKEDVKDTKVKGFYLADGTYWRRNGKIKEWKTRPEDFQLPLKYGLRDYAYLTPVNLDLFYVRKTP